MICETTGKLQFDFPNIHFNVINIKTIKRCNFSAQTDVKRYEMRWVDGLKMYNDICLPYCLAVSWKKI